MASKEDLKSILTRMDGHGYKADKEMEGSFDYGTFLLRIDLAQGGPIASPSRVRAFVPLGRTGFPSALFGHAMDLRGCGGGQSNANTGNQIRKG